MTQISIQRGSYLALDRSEDRPGEYLLASNADFDGLMYFTRNQLAQLRNAITEALGDRFEVTAESLAAQARPFTPYERAKLILALKYQQNDPTFDPAC